MVGQASILVREQVEVTKEDVDVPGMMVVALNDWVLRQLQALAIRCQIYQPRIILMTWEVRQTEGP